MTPGHKCQSCKPHRLNTATPPGSLPLTLKIRLVGFKERWHNSPCSMSSHLHIYSGIMFKCGGRSLRKTKRGGNEPCDAQAPVWSKPHAHPLAYCFSTIHSICWLKQVVMW